MRNKPPYFVDQLNLVKLNLLFYSYIPNVGCLCTKRFQISSKPALNRYVKYIITQCFRLAHILVTNLFNLFLKFACVTTRACLCCVLRLCIIRAELLLLNSKLNRVSRREILAPLLVS